MVAICWILNIIAGISAMPGVGVEKGLAIIGVGVMWYILPTIFVWKRLFSNFIPYYFVIIFSIMPYTLGPYITAYVFTYIFTVMLSLYFNYKPVLIVGISNLFYTCFFVFNYAELVFPTYLPVAYLIPLLASHVLITSVLVTQSILGNKMREHSLFIEQDSKIDALTGALNIKMYHEYMDYMFEKKRENKSIKMQLAVVDIDNFKNINDTYGHSIGDLILKRIANVLMISVNDEDYVIRYGGEEFVIIFMDKSFSESYKLAEACRIAVQDYFHEEVGAHNPVTVSMGLENFNNASNKEELFRKADELLYLAKRNGKNQTKVYKQK